MGSTAGSPVYQGVDVMGSANLGLHVSTQAATQSSGDCRASASCSDRACASKWLLMHIVEIRLARHHSVRWAASENYTSTSAHVHSKSNSCLQCTMSDQPSEKNNPSHDSSDTRSITYFFPKHQEIPIQIKSHPLRCPQGTIRARHRPPLSMPSQGQSSTRCRTRSAWK